MFGCQGKKTTLEFVMFCKWLLFSSLTRQVSKNGMVNSVFTLYELSNGDDTEGEGMIPFIYF